MVRMAGKLTDVGLRHWMKAGLPVTKSDGAGLTFTLSSKGTATWVLRYRIGGKQRELTLGRYPDLTLTRARELAAEKRVAVQQGVDVAQAKQEQKATLAAAGTVRELCEQYYERTVKDRVKRPDLIKDILPMRGNYVLYSARGRFSTVGAVRVEVDSEWHNSVVDLVGRAIEEKRGGSDRVWQDDHQCAMERPNYPEALAKARRFVNKYFNLIEFTATAFLMLANKATGEIHPGRLNKLIVYLRPKLLMYASTLAAM